MQQFRTLIFPLFLFFSFLIAGCSSKDENSKSATPLKPSENVTTKETVVMVPEVVKGKWKAVKIAITDKVSNKEDIVTIDIGGKYSIPGSDITVQVDKFLPHFVMEGATLTSQSNDPKNPAVLIRIFQSNEEVFKGWLFTLYPTTHAFKHPQYTFSLVDFVPLTK